MFPSAGNFFFQAEDGIRDIGVTGVQTCALPISADAAEILAPLLGMDAGELGAQLVGDKRYVAIRRGVLPDVWRAIRAERITGVEADQIGRASCRERGVDLGGRRLTKKKRRVGST